METNVVHKELGDGLTLIEVTSIKTKEKYRYVIDSEDLDFFMSNSPLHHKKSYSKGGLSVLLTDDLVPVMNKLLNPKKEKDMIAYNINRNPFDLRKINYALIQNGKQHSKEFKKFAEKKKMENRKSDLAVAKIINNEAVKEKKQDQDGGPDSAGVRVWQDYVTKDFAIEFTALRTKVDGINIETAKTLARYLQPLLQS
jgi:hypothetical protein